MILAVGLALASVVPFHQQPPTFKNGWRDTQVAAPKNQPVKIQLSLQRDETKLAAARAILNDIADPSSPNWREWSSGEKVAAFSNPRKGAMAAAAKWLVSNGVRSISRKTHVLEFTIPVAEAEKLLGTTFFLARNDVTGQVKALARQVHLPSEVAPFIQAIYGIHGLPLPPRAKTQRTLKDDSTAVGPAELIRTYGVTVKRGTGNLKVRQAVAEFQGQYINQDDITAFFKNLVPGYKSGDDKVYKYIGDQGSSDGIEALLDVEYIMGVAPGVKTEFWSYQQIDFCSDLKNWTSHMISDVSDQPVVISVSYGWQGDLPSIGCSDAQVADIDNDFSLIAQKGIAIVFASGDSGSGWDGSNLYASWPASSPWVTAVGSTCFTNGLGSPESATTQFGSGSGFWSGAAQPSWQAKFVQRYLSTAQGLPPSTYYNASGRATADVSAHGENFQVYVDGSVELVGGTSASAPLFASLIALINDQLVSAGKKPLGYLNKFLYANPSAFTDILVGSDKIGRDGSALDYGFPVTAGWDPATGLGTPKFSVLLDAAKKL